MTTASEERRTPIAGEGERVAAAGAGHLAQSRFDTALVLVTLALSVWTVGGIIEPQFEFTTIVPSVDLVFDTMGLLVTIGAAGLAWVEYRDRGEAIDLLQRSAFLALAIPNAIHLALVMTTPDADSSAALLAQSQVAVWAFAVATLLGAVLFALAAWRPGRVLGRAATVTVVLAPVLVLGVAALAAVSEEVVPRLGSFDGVTLMPQVTPLGVLIGGATAVTFLIAALFSRRWALRSGRQGQAYLTVGLVFAAFASADSLNRPAFAGIVGGSDVLRLAFYLVLLIGLAIGWYRTARALRAANERLARLQAAEIERAALEERSRLSRELHDGLAQQLWYAKLTTGRLAAVPEMPAEAQSMIGNLASAIDASLAEARQALTALRPESDPRASLRDLLTQSTDEFADRFGVRTERRIEADDGGLPPRVRAEVLRIAQEALQNVGRHADATLVHVEWLRTGGALVLSIRDNGCGFDARQAEVGRFGLTGMRERAVGLGADLRVDSGLQAGTRITLTIPTLTEAASA
jgi:signal transduction histidine kinase